MPKNIIKSGFGYVNMDKGFKGIGFKSGSYLYKSIVAIITLGLVEIISNYANTNLPLIRYAISGISLYYFLMAVIYERSRYVGSGISRYLAYLYLAWVLIIALFGIVASLSGKYNYLDFKLLISGRLMMFLLPFIIIINTSKDTLKRVFFIANIFADIYLIGSFLLIWHFISNNNNDAELWIKSFGSCAVIIVLTIRYHSMKISIKSIVVFVVGAILTGYMARRNVVIYCASVLVFAASIYIADMGIKMKHKSMNILLVSIVFILMILYAANLLDYSLLFERLNQGFDSRSGVIQCFYDDFDVNGGWIVGRGMFGKVDGGNLGLRMAIENGYLYYVLHGGYIYLTFFVLLSVVSMYNLLFKSNNMLCKGYCALLAINLIDMIGYGIPSLTLRYIYVWLAIAAGLSTNLRLMSDKEVGNAISLK